MSAYELRTYVVAPGKMPEIQEAFRALVAPLMTEHGMAGVGYWAEPDGSKLHYIVRHHDLGAIESNWGRFHADRRWTDGIAERENGTPFVQGVQSVPLQGIEGLGPQLQDSNRETARNFLGEFFNDKRLGAADQHLAPDFVQHNPGAPDGVSGLKTFAGGFFGANPDVRIDTIRVAAEGDLVFLHGRLKMTADDRGMALVDIYRFKDGRIAEHWDVIQAIPEQTASGNAMV